MLPIIVILLFGQSLALDLNFKISKQQCDNITLDVNQEEDLTTLVGKWYITHYWIMANRAQRLLKPSNCPEIYAEKATAEDIEHNKKICNNVPEPFDLERVKLKLPHAGIEDFDVLIADSDGYFNYMLPSCDYVVSVIFVRLNEDYVLAATPEGGGVLELLSRNTYGDELKCVIDAVDEVLSAQGFFGGPFC